METRGTCRICFSNMLKCLLGAFSFEERCPTDSSWRRSMAPFSFRISFSLWLSLFFVIVLRYCLKGKDFHPMSVFPWLKVRPGLFLQFSLQILKFLFWCSAYLCLVTYGQLKVIPGIAYMNYVPGHNELDVFSETDCNFLLLAFKEGF